VGENGTILTTDDAGYNWKRQSSGTSVPLHSVYFASANRGWVVGEKGTVLMSEDGGNNWKPQYSGTLEPLQSIAFTNADHGTVVGSHRTILTTRDGGKTWQRPDPPSRYPAPWYYLTVL